MTRAYRLLKPLLPILCLLVVGGAWWGIQEWYTQAHDPSGYPEVHEISSATDLSFQDLSTYFQKLADTKGAEYAFDVLRYATFPPNTDIHLLGHVVGDMLYKQQGVDGIHLCTQEFRNACSHSIVVGMLTEHGPGALPEIVDTCKQAPGGRGAYTMCFHGLGHGVLAFNGYDFKKAVDMCKETGTKEYEYREYHECVGGMMMEMIAGVHDRGAWEKQVANYIDYDNPLSPCNAAYLDDEVRPMCYSYLTPSLFIAAGTTLDIPDPAYYAKAFSFCAELTGESRDACYGGFGKEFIGFVTNREIRNLSLNEEQIGQIREWCALAGAEDGEAVCSSFVLASLFWGGEATPDTSFLFCKTAEGDTQNRCYQELAEHIDYYFRGTVRGDALCRQVPQEYRAACQRL